MKDLKLTHTIQDRRANPTLWGTLEQDPFSLFLCGWNCLVLLISLAGNFPHQCNGKVILLAINSMCWTFPRILRLFWMSTFLRRRNGIIWVQVTFAITEYRGIDEHRQICLELDPLCNHQWRPFSLPCERMPMLKAHLMSHCCALRREVTAKQQSTILHVESPRFSICHL